MRAATRFCLLAMLAFATPVRANTLSPSTWVSSNGNDGNQSAGCLQDAPCQTFLAALQATEVGGTVSCVTPSWTFGTVTISQDVTIDCSGGVVTGDGVFGLPAITINTAIRVILRGLVISGVTIEKQPSAGINVTAGALVRVEQCRIAGFLTGVLAAPGSGSGEVKIQDTTIAKNSAGILVAPTGGASVAMSIDRSQIENGAGGGIHADSSNGSINLDVTDSAVSDNASNGFNVTSGTGGQNNVVNVARTTIARNGLVGIQAGGGNAAVLLDSTLLDSNANGATLVLNAGRVLSYGNNRIVGGAGSGFTGSASLQ